MIPHDNIYCRMLRSFQNNIGYNNDADPNAIAYNSKQFSSGKFFKWGIPASIVLLIILELVVTILWPLMGMPITLAN